MDLLHALGELGGLVGIMAVAAIFLLVAVNATEIKHLDMLLMIKGHHGATLVGSIIHPLHRFGNYGMSYACYIGFIFTVSRSSGTFLGNMTDYTFGSMTPFAVAAHALSMKCPFQARLSKILGFRCYSAMAFAARQDLASWAVMMALTAALSHPHHLGVVPVVESNRPIHILELIQNGDLRPFRR